MTETAWLLRLRARVSGNPVQALQGIIQMLKCHSMAPGYRDAHYHTLPAGFADDRPPI